jgi:hypothetical protein
MLLSLKDFFMSALFLLNLSVGYRLSVATYQNIFCKFLATKLWLAYLNSPSGTRALREKLAVQGLWKATKVGSTI